MATSLLRRPFDLLIFVYYTVHVPVALLFDGQALLPEHWFPKFAVDTNNDYVRQYGDPLVSEKPAWFRGFIAFELLVQVPFWIVASYAYAIGDPRIRLPNLVFSVASLTAMVPIISELLLTDAKFARWTVLLIYTPFVVMPAAIALKTMLADDLLPSAKKKGNKAL